MTPNLLLVVFDTARADTFEPYGARPGSTPVISDLARRGRVTRRAYATSNWTLPSHASMLTGVLPRALPDVGGGPGRDALGEAAERSIAAVLRARGYRTAGVSANPWVGRRRGFAHGFERFEEIAGLRKHRPREGFKGRARWALDAVRARIDDGMSDAATVVERWLAETDATPFFWFVNLMECHSPYLPPRPYNDLGVVGRLRAASDARRYQSHDGFLRVCLGELDVPPAALARMRHLYDRAVRAMDDWLGRILEAMDRRGVLDETLVVVTSDHGENFGEGHLLGHVLSLDDRLIRVPLVAAGPGSESFPDEKLMSLAALPRTVADAMAIPDHPWSRDAVPSGVGVAQADGFSGLAPAAADALVKAWHIPPHLVERLYARRSCATDGRFKLVREDDGVSLHDLHEDPEESTDVIAGHADVADRLGSVLEAVDAATQPAAAPTTGGDGSAGDADADLEDRMRLLGYL